MRSINALPGLSIEHKIIVADKERFPISINIEELVICQDFYEHPELRDCSKSDDGRNIQLFEKGYFTTNG